MAKSALKRGFAAQADRTALEIRKTLGAGVHDRVDPFALAEHLGVRVFRISELGGNKEKDKAVKRLMVEDPQAFSGGCIELDGALAIVINDSHSPERQASTIAHECAHILCDHEPEDHFGDHGMRQFNVEKEAEADRLGDSLLVPNEGAKLAMFKHRSLESSATHFGVSLQLMRKRFNMSGGKQVMQRSRQSARY